MVKRRPRPASSESAGGEPPAGDRPLFDPSKMAARAPTNAPDPRADAMRVRELAALIDSALRTGVPPNVRVVGEVSGFRDRTHWWFDLKDEDAVISCVMFKSGAARAGFVPENGQEVVATGRVEHYARQGKTQLYVEALAPVGAGALELRYRALCEELRALGWFDPARKRPLPWFPRRVAVVTSRTGAALQDVLDTMRRRCPAVGVLLVDVMVQGERAAPRIADALRFLSREHERLGVDAVIVTRGGGSMEDLWAFNERVVAEAIVRCDVPVVAAIGHETDTTIAELVADERCATPTQAAMRLTPDRAALAQQTDQYVRRLRAALRSRLSDARARAERLGARLAHARPEAVYAARRERLLKLEHRLRDALRAQTRRHDPASMRDRLDRALRFAHKRRAERVNTLGRSLEAVSPVRVLARGYSVTTGADGRIVRASSDVAPGDTIETRLADGRVRSVVSDDGARQSPSQTRTRKPAPKPNEPPMDLFDTDRYREDA